MNPLACNIEVLIPGKDHVPHWFTYVIIGDLGAPDFEASLSIAREDAQELREFYRHVRITHRGEVVGS